MVKTEKLRNLFMKIIEMRENDPLYIYSSKILGFLFLEEEQDYRLYISGVLKDLIPNLNQKQKTKLCDEFNSIEWEAKFYGFYKDYYSIIRQISSQTKNIFEKIIEFISRRIFFITLMILFVYEHQKGYPVNPYLFYTIPLLGSFILRAILNSREYSYEQFSNITLEIAGLNDRLVSSHKKKDKEEALKRIRELLIKHNWIDKDGKIILE
ncbi:hypothetical protein GF385_01355 [Candidatus Dependentiae bacterium]|nr:hypothetical protein [Candidatus Dependentiae bacterium]